MYKSDGTNHGTTEYVPRLNKRKISIPSLRVEHGDLAMENDCIKSLFITSCSDCKTSLPPFHPIPQQATSSSIVSGSRQSLSWVSDFAKTNGKRRSVQDKRNDQSPMNQGTMATTVKQRSSVIRWARKEVSFATVGDNIPFTDIQSLETTDMRYQLRKSSNDKDKNSCSGKLVNNVHLYTKTPTSQTSSKSKECKYNCISCGKLFQWYSHWKAHERIHTGERPYKCDECGKAFSRSDGLQCHKLIHFNNKVSQFQTKRVKDNVISYEQFVEAVDDKDVFGPSIIRENDKKLFKCRFCSRVLDSSAQFLKHVHRHKGKFVFKCNICDKAFPKPSALEIHKRIHTGERPYQCNTCTKSFSIYGNLKRHLIIHTGEKPYTCSKCSSSFNNPSHLSRHIKNKHEEVVSNLNI